MNLPFITAALVLVHAHTHVPTISNGNHKCERGTIIYALTGKKSYPVLYPCVFYMAFKSHLEIYFNFHIAPKRKYELHERLKKPVHSYLYRHGYHSF